MKNPKSIRALFAFPGFTAVSKVGVFGDQYAHVIPLKRRKKTALCSHCGHRCRSRYDKKILRVRDLSVAGWRIYLEFERWRVRCPRCDGVHVEHLNWLAKKPRYTQCFALHVGKLCRDIPIAF